MEASIPWQRFISPVKKGIASMAPGGLSPCKWCILPKEALHTWGGDAAFMVAVPPWAGHTLPMMALPRWEGMLFSWRHYIHGKGISSPQCFLFSRSCCVCPGFLCSDISYHSCSSFDPMCGFNTILTLYDICFGLHCKLILGTHITHTRGLKAEPSQCQVTR
jgi:hypothetical protein